MIWTFDTLRTKGTPFYRSYYANVAKVEPGRRARVSFHFDGTDNRELPQILGPAAGPAEALLGGPGFREATLEPPLGSGPYRVEASIPAAVDHLRARARLLGRESPVNKGRNNFDQIRYEYYRDANVALEAFKAGQYDVRVESSSPDLGHRL